MRLCVFCEKRTGDPEHAWPRWLQRWINPTGGISDVQLANGTLIPQAGWDTAKVNTVCTRCNRWMGRKFEEQVAPVFKELDQAHSARLAAKKQRLLASWAYKTALMLECARAGGTEVNADVYRRFRSSHTPPPDCSLVIGLTDYRTLAFSRIMIVIGRDANGEPTRWVYVTVLVASHIIFHMVGDVGPTNAFDLHQRLAPALINTGLHRIWPLQSGFVKWPPDAAFTKDALRDLIQIANAEFDFI